MKCMKNEGLRTFTREEKLDLSRNPSGEGEEVEWEVFGKKMREFFSREISEKWRKIALTLYIDKYATRWIEITITTIEKRCSRGSTDSLAVERYREAVEIAQKMFF